MKRHLDILSERRPEIRFFVHGRSVLTMECKETVPTGPQAPVDGPYVTPLPDLEEFINTVADENDGLTVYPWGVGRPKNSYTCYKGLKDLHAVSNSPTALGVAATLGHHITFEEDLGSRFPIAKKLLAEHDVFLHLDEVDEYSHQKDHEKKKWVLEHTDKMMEKYFPDVENIIYFADHGTSCVTGEHILTDVPVWTSIDAGIAPGSIHPLATLVPDIVKHKRRENGRFRDSAQPGRSRGRGDREGHHVQDLGEEGRLHMHRGQHPHFHHTRGLRSGGYPRAHHVHARGRCGAPG
jgi:2,3-bisphosphoglycerate-independent phosphoglycerate mutase